MALDPREELHLVDKSGQRLGSVAILRIEGDRVYGRFVADKEFGSINSLFASLESAVNNQLFHEVDRISDEIERLEIRLVAEDAKDSLWLEDVQIMDGADVSFHVPHLQLTQLVTDSAPAGA